MLEFELRADSLVKVEFGLVTELEVRVPGVEQFPQYVRLSWIRQGMCSGMVGLDAAGGAHGGGERLPLPLPRIRKERSWELLHALLRRSLVKRRGQGYISEVKRDSM